MIFQVFEKENGKCLGTVEAPDVYSGARDACLRFFKSPALPFRETGWAGTSGTFSVQNDDGSHGRKFYMRVPS